MVNPPYPAPPLAKALVQVAHTFVGRLDFERLLLDRLANVARELGRIHGGAVLLQGEVLSASAFSEDCQFVAHHDGRLQVDPTPVNQIGQAPRAVAYIHQVAGECPELLGELLALSGQFGEQFLELAPFHARCGVAKAFFAVSAGLNQALENGTEGPHTAKSTGSMNDYSLFGLLASSGLPNKRTDQE
jgi:hypothetical protein